MKRVKVIVYVVVFLMVTLSFAFAGPSTGNDVLNKVIARTDMSNIFVPKVSETNIPTAVPTPYKVQEPSKNVELQDITKECTNGWEIVPTFPKKVYEPILNHENYRIIKVYSYIYPKGDERKVEVWYAGGDWMHYGLVYFVINAGVDKNSVRAYLIKELSTGDLEEGSSAPWIDPLDLDPNSPKKLAEFIVSDFLGPNGNVKEELFIKVAQFPLNK